MPATLTIVDVELGSVERATGVAYVADAQLEAGTALNVGERLTLRDEGQCLYEAVVEQVVPGMYGNRYRTKSSSISELLRSARRSLPGADDPGAVSPMTR